MLAVVGGGGWGVRSHERVMVEISENRRVGLRLLLFLLLLLLLFFFFFLFLFLLVLLLLFLLLSVLLLLFLFLPSVYVSFVSCGCRPVAAISNGATNHRC